MNHQKNLLFAAAAVCVALGCSDTAYAQTQLTVSPSTATNPSTPLTFTNILSGGGSRTPQIVTVTAAVNTSVIVQVNLNSPWLIVTPSVTNLGPNNPASLVVSVNTNVNGQVLSNGTYNGSFTVSISAQNQVTVYVTMTVAGSSLLSATPSSLTFSANQGATFASPSSGCTNVTQNGCVVQISSSGAALNYTLQATTTAGSNWLLLSSNSGSTGDAGFLVSVNPSALPPTTTSPYTGSITALSTTTNDSVTISVSLTVTSSAVLSVTPSAPPPFLYQINKTAPQPQTLLVNATGGTANFSARLSPSVSWVVLSPFSGQASDGHPVTLTLSANPSGLQAGTYNTSVVVTPLGGADLAPVSITLVISNNPLLQLSTSSLGFTSQFGSNQSPPDQQVNVTGSDNGLVGFNFTSDSTWLTASASSSATPGVLTIHVNPSGLLVQTYNGVITVRPTNGDNYGETIAVTLNVMNGSAITAGPPDLLFSFQTTNNQQALSQAVQLQSSGPPVSFSASASTSTCSQNWLATKTSSSTTPSTLTVTVTTLGMTPGTCSGTVTVTYNSGNGVTSLAIPVTVAVSNTAELQISMPTGFGNETVPLGASNFTRQIALTSTDALTPVSFNVGVSSIGGTWLLAGAGSNFTPQNLVIQFLPQGLGSGTYTGQIVINSPSLGTTQLIIPVTLTVTSNITVAASASTLSFSESQGGTLPAAQNLTLTSTGGNTATYTASIPSITGGNWLQVSPNSGQASGNVQVSILANNLSPGDYPAQILLTFQGAATQSATVNVTLHVSTPQNLTLSATSLNFNYQIAGTAPTPQKISVGGTNGVAFSVGTTSSGWLSADTVKGTSPQDITVSVNTAGLTAGTYNGTVSVSSPGVLASPIQVGVTLIVAAAPSPQPITVVSAASGVAGVIAPGELITIKGNNLGPATPANGVSFTVNGSGGVDSKLANVRVLFDNIPGTPIYVSATQINVSVPYEVSGRLSSNVVVEYNGVQSTGIPLRLADTALGLFTNNFSGTGQVAAINQNGTYNGTASGFTPAPQDSEVSIYATGGGNTNPASATGSVTPVPRTLADLVRIPGTVTATVGGVQATVDFAGNAPGLITGIVQFNVHVPKGVTGNAQITISINGVTSPLGTTIAVQ